MGEVDILHPKTCLKKHPTMKSHHRTIRSAHNSPNPSSRIPSITLPHTRQQTPAKGILKNPNTNSVTQNKNIVMGQVKILKRGEVLKDVNHVKKVEFSNRPENFEVKGHRTCRVNLAENKKMEKKDKKMVSNSSRGVLQVSNSQDVVVSSTNRIGPDPKIVSKQMKNKMTECFSGSVFSDSPHPSSVPLPSFFMKNRSKTMNS